MTELCLNLELEDFYCPISGEKILHPEGYYTPPSLLFIYIPEVCEFEYTSEKFRTAFPDDFDENGNARDAYILFNRLKENETWGIDKVLFTTGELVSVSMCLDLEYEKESSILRISV